MSSFKNIFRNSGKDSSNPSSPALSKDHKRFKSLSGSSSSHTDHPSTADESYSVGGAFPSKNGSLPVSPFSAPTKLPAIDVTDLSNLDHQQSPSASDVSTPKPTDSFHTQSDPRRDSKGSRSMPRPSSSNHAQWRSEPAQALASNGGKSSRRSSKVEKSDDGHGKPEPLNRHELMRRAMATAQEYSETDADDSGSVFDDDQDHLSNSLHSHTPHFNQQSAHIPNNHQHPNTSTPITSRQAPPQGPPADRPGDGSLSIDAFGTGPAQAVSDASHAPAPATATATASRGLGSARSSTTIPSKPTSGPAAALTHSHRFSHHARSRHAVPYSCRDPEI